MELKKILASTLRQKIIKELNTTKEIRIMQLVNRTNTTYNELNRNLLILSKEGIITDKHQVKVRHGKVRVVVLNLDNPKTQALLQVLKLLDNSN